MSDRFMAATDQQRHARLQPAFGRVDHRDDVDMARLRLYRFERVQRELQARDYAGVLLYDPINIRYATGTRNMTIWTMHNAARYCFVPAQGKATIFDYRNCEHLANGIETVGEARRGTFWYYFSVADRQQEVVAQWAREIDDLVRAAGRRQSPLGDRPRRCGRQRRAQGSRLEPLQWPGTAGTRAQDQIRGRALLHGCGAHRVRGGARKSAERPRARSHRDRALVVAGRDEYRHGRRVHGNAPAELGRTHQSVVPGMQRAARAAARADLDRHRHGRPVRLRRRHLAHLLLRSGEAERRAAHAVRSRARAGAAQRRAASSRHRRFASCRRARGRRPTGLLRSRPGW